MVKTLRRKNGTPHDTPTPSPAPMISTSPLVESPQSSPQASPASTTSSLPKSHSFDSNSSGSQTSGRSDTNPPSFASFTCSEASSASSPPLSPTNSQHRGPLCRSQSSSGSSFLLFGPLPTEGPAGSGPSNTPMGTPSRLKKQSRPPSTRSHRSDFTPTKSSPQRNVIPGDPECTDCVVETLRPGRAILSGAGGDSPKKWVHVLDMTLEELFHGKLFHFRILRYTRVGKKKIFNVDIHIPPGSRTGTEVLIPNIGHERRDGTRQDIAFLVKEQEHPRFNRVQDDLVMEVRLPWLDTLATEPGDVYLRSVDDRDYKFTINYCSDQQLTGTTVLPDAGMPRRSAPKERGRIIVR